MGFCFFVGKANDDDGWRCDDYCWWWDIRTNGKMRRRALINQLLIWLTVKPVLRHSIIFSCSVGYGCWKWSISHCFRIAVTDLGRLPRRRLTWLVVDMDGLVSLVIFVVGLGFSDTAASWCDRYGCWWCKGDVKHGFGDNDEHDDAVDKGLLLLLLLVPVVVRVSSSSLPSSIIDVAICCHHWLLTLSISFVRSFLIWIMGW